MAISTIQRRFKKAKDIITEKGPINGLFFPLIHFSPEPIKSILIVTREEIEDGFKVDLPLRHRLRAYKHGFTSKRYCELNLQNRTNLDKYLSRFSEVNSYSKVHKNKELLTNKIKFYQYMKQKGLGEYLPKLYGIIKDGEVRGNKKFFDILQKYNKVIVKPSLGSRGDGIRIFELEHDDIKVNGEIVSYADLEYIIRNIGPSIITEYCTQADFLDEIYSESTNTIRILIFNHNEEFIIGYAYLRIGTDKSGFVDNISCGGLATGIDLKTGKLSSAAQKIYPGKVRWHKIHPDTKSKIKGRKIPKWNQFKNNFLSIIDDLNDFNCVAWDILFTSKEEFVIIEGNNNGPGQLSGQRFRPLLEDPRIKKFYKEHGVIL